VSAAARSVAAFGVYLLVLGAGLMLAPDLMLAIFGRPPATDPWLRVVGIVTLVLSFYYLRAARAGVETFFRWTVLGRPFAAAALVVLVAAGPLPPFVLLLAAADLAGAAWTWVALRQTGRRR
jgi:hypothetical protein